MKTLTVLFSAALYLTVIDLSCSEPSEQHDHHKQIRHRPKRQYLGGDYGYQYQHHPSAWYRPRYPEDRRDDRNQQDLLPQIYRLLEEISDFVRRPPPPPPPPQPIYIPYPVQYPCPQRCKCPTGLNGKPNVTSRFPEIEDSNQNWGYDDSEEADDDESNSRPINFDPIPPSVSTSRPPPNVEHGTLQASATGQGRIAQTNTRRPRRCDAMVLSCCDPTHAKQQQRACFTSVNCAAYYDKREDVCAAQSVQEVLDLFASTYAPSK